MDLPQTLWEEIDFEEIELENKVVGKGTYGLVKKGAWKGKDVAVKIIETDQERRAFFIEVRQLSRVNHANIVKLYGACTKSPVCLVMEYAEGGSLYNVLHCSPKVQYTVAHAISWVYQCAKGVAYLHNMKPKALIHRDLKPPNLLLVMGGTILKICDFGTACDLQTNMTNNKGSAAWMAPEVFESSKYSEKCDVFSLGIILWEVLTRRKPFDEIGGPAFRIMWAVHSGERPPLIEGCPKPLENLMTRCWSKQPMERPSMSEVEEHLSPLYHFFQDESVVPIIYPPSDEFENVDEDSLDSTNNQIEDLSQPEHAINRQEEPSTGNTEQCYEPPPLPTPTIMPNQPSRTSAPASLSSSKENLEESSKQRKQNLLDPNKRKSADFTELKPHIYGHRRTGSYGSSTIIEPLDSVHPHLSTGDLNASQHSASKENVCKEEEISAMHRKRSWPHSIGSTYGSDTDLSDWNAYLLLEPKLQPLPPVITSKESMEIYEAHRRAANEYVHVQTEITLLAQRKKELEEELKEDQQKTSTYIEEYLQLRNEKDSLTKLRESLKQQIEVIKTEKQNRRRTISNNGEDWVVV